MVAPVPGRASVPVFLLSLKAGGTGLNLTRADHVIHVDRWWNPAVEDQATDRAYRIGQTRPVQVHRMVTRGTIEERVAELLARKRALADAVLGRGEAALTELERRRAARPGHACAAEPTAGRAGDRAPSRTRGSRAAPRRRPGRARGGARPGCARSRSRRTASATCAPAAPWPAPGAVGGDHRRRRAGSLAAVEDDDGLWTVDRHGAGARPSSRRRRSSRRSRPRPAGSPRCWPASCRTRWSSTPRRPASSCCPTAASWAPTCTCDAWVDPCPHALAVLLQVAWLVEADPFVLLAAARAAPRATCWPGCTRGPRPSPPPSRTTPTTRRRRRRGAGPAAAGPARERRRRGGPQPPALSERAHLSARTACGSSYQPGLGRNEPMPS